ncbi:autotransporter outer membrane beta-barrel domain-containing protein [Moraxella sp. FZLJ2107]|uniref:autotransporter outer membrane beta-barrel domain-containing protein n=1 Tax=unclassified Moraxella TaxID=2685852 RepID=UPI0020C90E73|nr:MULTISPECIES: autotransporter outer membrane beta-barrel domain-containing protein [unclassified Moraxella]UTO04346.1 autotransporter outer membrane beta-barrel domain-containing protein [Moraxella sp. FZLJ2107]UTO23179.1 autotransporter outer membrane beta-barrel domain-containing protein [Moraxella sp. FZLJ2109]
MWDLDLIYYSPYFNNEYMGASEIDSNGFGLHATTDVGPTTVGAYLGGYNIKNTVNRQIDTVSEISNAHAIQKAQLLQMGVSAGIEHKLKYGLVGLDVGGQIEHLKTKSFEESNNPLGLSEDDSNDSFGMVYANGRFKLPIAYNKPHFIQGELGVQHDLKQRNTMNTSWDVPRTRGLIGADFKFEITEGIYAAIGVKHNFSSTHKSTSGLLEVNMQF